MVTKTADGFLVNGSPSKSLSGSTLDILSIAVRVALTKVFLPNMDMLILDEPAHGADRDRTASILGFLSSIGYRQVIIATHDEISEAVATQTFALEAK